MAGDYLSMLVGDHPTALARPYLPGVPEEKIGAINERAERTGSLRFQLGKDAIEYMQSLDTSVTAIEVFGAWEGGCVLGTIVHALRSGLKVRVPKGFTIMPDTNFEK